MIISQQITPQNKNPSFTSFTSCKNVFTNFYHKQINYKSNNIEKLLLISKNSSTLPSNIEYNSKIHNFSSSLHCSSSNFKTNHFPKPSLQNVHWSRRKSFDLPLAYVITSTTVRHINIKS